jgi:hypothetical protein
LSKRLSFKTTEEVKALIGLTALRLHCDVGDLIHDMFLKLALENLDDIEDVKIRELFKEVEYL